MTDPAIIEAAARALREDADIQLWGIVGHEDYYPVIARCILTAVTPLIEAAALEKAAKVTEDYDRGGAFAWMARDIAAAIRALSKSEAK